MVSGMDTHEKVRENRLRRAAERQGFTLRKSRRRDRLAPDYGEMWLLRERVWDPRSRSWQIVASPEQTHDAWEGPFHTLDDLERHLTRAAR